MKVIQLGGVNDGLCHFLSLEGYAFLLDCGIYLDSLTFTSFDGNEKDKIHPIKALLPPLDEIDIKSLDVILISNHYSIFALPLLTEYLGFEGKIYTTKMTKEFGFKLLEEMVTQENLTFEYAVFSSDPNENETQRCSLPRLSKDDIQNCSEKITLIELKEVIELPYGVKITPLSSGFSLGSAMWLLESANDKFSYIPAASADLNRHPKELDFAPMIDCDTLLITDLKPHRDPLSTTEHMVEHFLSSVTHVVNRNGVCVIPCSPCGVVFDLVETIYAYLHAHKRQVPMYLVGSHVQEIIHLAEVGAEWVAEKKVEKLYCGESAFIHGGLIKNKLLHVVPQITSSMAATMQNGSIVFVTHPSLRFGEVMNLMHRFGHSSQNALIFIDPLFNPSQIIVPFQHFEIERIYCIIDSRLTCGDANQLIARCAPKQLLIPEEFTMEPPNHPPTGSGVPHGTSSHLSHVLQLNELIAPRPKIELQTFAMRHMEPISIDRSSKYVDGLLDIKLAKKVFLTEVNGKAVGNIRGILAVKRDTYVLQEEGRLDFGHTFIEVPCTPSTIGTKRKSRSAPNIADSMQHVQYAEKSGMLLGIIDEDKLLDQIKTHDSNLDVYISGTDSEVLMSIPTLDARITIWKEEGRTKLETSKEDVRSLLTSHILAQLVSIPP